MFRLLLCSIALLPTVSFAGDGPGHWVVSDVESLTKAVSEVTPSGGTIVLRPGNYVIEHPLRFEGVRLLNIEGGGWSTQIHKKGDGDAIVFKDCSFCAVRDLLISGDGKSKAGSGIHYVGQSSSCTVDFCRITGFAESGVRYDGDANSPMSSNTVRDCHFIDNRQVQLHSRYNNDFYIIGNQFGAHSKPSPRIGCFLDHSSAGTYTLNYHWGNVNAFHLGPGSHYNRIENNRFEESRETGIIIGAPDSKEATVHNSFIGNTIHTNSEGSSGVYPAVAAYYAHAFIFTGNQVFSWDCNSVKHKASLVLDDHCMHWIIRDNIFRHNTDKALIYNREGQHIVKDNHIH